MQFCVRRLCWRIRYWAAKTRAGAVRKSMYSATALCPTYGSLNRRHRITVRQIGTGNDNLAITAMDVRRGYSAGSNYQIFAQCAISSKQPRSVNLELSHDRQSSRGASAQDSSQRTAITII
jgi:stage V sporulation protein SpoVS